MALLASAFSLITPDFGLFFWTVLIFVLLWVILGKFAFGPINKSLRERADSIEQSLRMAEKAREEMAALQSDHQRMLVEATEERGRIVQEARETAAALVEEAREKAKAEAERIVASAAEQINNQKMAALVDVKNSAGKMALDIAEKVLRRELQDKAAQESYINGLVDEFKMN
jgi:F-type H+-transporting ATPase subunit b